MTAPRPSDRQPYGPPNGQPSQQQYMPPTYYGRTEDELRAADAAARAQLAADARRSSTRRKWIGGSLATVAVLIVIGAANQPSPSRPTVLAGPAASTTTAVPVGAAPAPAPAPPVEPSGPTTTLTNGTWLVGTDVELGTYVSPGPEPGAFEVCYVDVQNEAGRYLEQEVTREGQTRIRLREAGTEVKVSGCLPFTRQG